MKKVNSNSYRSSWDVMFSNIKHSSQVEREVCKGGECVRKGHQMGTFL